MIMILILIVITYRDWKKRKIDNLCIIIIFTLGFLRCFAQIELKLTEQILGVFFISIPMILLNFIYPKCFGSGDIKLMSSAGFFLGVFAVWKAFCVGIFSAGIYVGLKIMFARNAWKELVPFGPFLSIGIILSMF